MRLLSEDFNLEQDIAQTRERAYVFASEAINPYFCKEMAAEIGSLNFYRGGFFLKRKHWFSERAYYPVGHELVPIATQVTELLVGEVTKRNLYPELRDWHPTEAGYQRYRDNQDWISPHRDRRNDKLLSATITISGSALMRMYEPIDAPDDYKNLRQTDEFMTSTGTLMLLRAPGFGNGEQIIHEVFPPQEGSRLILNLRMRPTILKTPQEFEAIYKRIKGER